MKEERVKMVGYVFEMEWENCIFGDTLQATTPISDYFLFTNSDLKNLL